MTNELNIATALAHDHTILAGVFAHQHVDSIGHCHAVSHTHPGSHSHGIGSHQHNTDLDHDHPNTSTGGVNYTGDVFGRDAGSTTGTGRFHNLNLAPLGTSFAISSVPSAIPTDTDATAHTASIVSTGGTMTTTASGQPASNQLTQSGQPLSNPSTQSGQPVSNPVTQSGQPASDLTTSSQLSAATSIEQPWRAVYFIERVPAAA